MPTTKVKRRTDAPDAYNVQRLKDQLAVQKSAQERVKEVGAIHENRRALTEMAFYPAHDQRLETSEYRAVHHEMVVTRDLPCLVCGVKNSTLKDKTANRYGAKAMETHHHIIEWALANAIDAKKFNGTVRPALAHKHPNNADYQKPFTDDQVRNWVDHSPDNLWVLCDVHHRAVYLGIHEITYPIWCPMDMLRDDFEQYVQQQVAKAKTEKPLKGKGKAAAAK